MNLEFPVRLVLTGFPVPAAGAREESMPHGLQTGHRAHTRLPYSQPASRHPDLFVSTIDDTTYGNSPLELKEVRTTEAGGPAVPLPGARFALSISQVVVVQSSRWREHHSVLAGRTQ